MSLSSSGEFCLSVFIFVHPFWIIYRVFPNYTCHVVCFSEVEADFLHHLRNPDPVLPEGFLLFHPTYS